tara:strand:+ start:503 stop:916 length:414 start_codon:yes stop_codon:yes gene_type:complete
MAYKEEKALMEQEQKEMKRRANLEGFATGGQAGMALGAQVGSAVPGIGTAAGAAGGLLVGGLVGALRSGKQYRELMKIQRGQEAIAKRQKKDAQASQRRALFAPYANISTPVETNLSASSPFSSSYDTFKARRFGGQ